MGARSALAALIAVGAGSLLYDLTLGLRLPDDASWAEAAGALRAEGRPGDAVQLWPAWAERGRIFVDAMPVLAEEDLASADYLFVQRLWILSLPGTPFYSAPDAALEARGATAVSAERRFGALALRAWDLHAPPVAADLTGAGEEHEVDYVARRCRHVAIGSRFTARGAAGSVLHLRAGVVGERAYDDPPPIEVRAFADGVAVGTLEVPRTLRDGTGWRKLEAPLPPGAPVREFAFAVRSSDPARPFCLQAWTTR